jgi:hypothetical protein
MTIKGDVCRKWGSNPNWRAGYDRIFGKRDDECPCDTCPTKELRLFGCMCDKLINHETKQRELDDRELKGEMCK